GGAVLTDGIHLLDRIAWFAGGDIVAVGGYLARNFQPGSIEDTALMLLRISNGVTAEVFFAWLSTPHPYQCDLQVVGTRGTVTIHTWWGYELHGETGLRKKVFYTDEPMEQKILNGLIGEVTEFYESIRDNREPNPSVEETTKALRVILTFYTVANQEKIVPLI
ncbi:Gfo/Idh/MocA family oxidoreductase, partial [Acidobacteria bacterium AH-259-O06]|nr:Gfo/Idh/MocA family oxidoreductase [Acidobacteria bacterium AH-259-O06]